MPSTLIDNKRIAKNALVLYVRMYDMALLFFIALYIPLIQNLGITILNKQRLIAGSC